MDDRWDSWSVEVTDVLTAGIWVATWAFCWAALQVASRADKMVYISVDKLAVHWDTVLAAVMAE